MAEVDSSARAPGGPDEAARSLARRKLTDLLVKAVSGLGAMVGIVFLVWILWSSSPAARGAINWGFFTELPAPPGMAGRRAGQRHRRHPAMTGAGRR